MAAKFAEFADIEVIRRVLTDSKTWAFVGLRDNPGRTAYDMAGLLQSRGKRIIPVHPSAETVFGEDGYATLADVPHPVDVVGVYRRAEHAAAVVDEAAARKARDAGLDVVMNRCPAIEWAKLDLPRQRETH